MRNISKQVFLNFLQCPTLGWLTRAGEITRPPTLGERFRMEEGIEVGRRARELYPDGVFVSAPDPTSTAEKTKSLMDDQNVSVLFESTFIVNESVARADVLERQDSGWHLIEVKSSINDKKEFIEDMAYTTMLIQRCGFSISAVSLLLLSKDFRLGMENKSLFVEIDHTNEVLDMAKALEPFWDQAREVTAKRAKPEPKLRFECRKCGLFKECLGRDPENHIFDLPRVSKSKFEKLAELGVFCIEDIPDGFPLTENQEIVKKCIQSGEVLIGGELKQELDLISWPAYYLDFETVNTAIPLYPDIAPYTQIPTQYSIHKCSAPGQIITDFRYLADPTKDCRKELAENMIKDLGGQGSIVIYTDFEKRVINSLAKLYPDLSQKLSLLIDRMVDLERIIRKNFYHPGFHGKTSIKITLPVLVPSMSYDDLEISEGDSAMATFANLALGKYEEGDIEAIKRNLLDYCAQDTLSMVKLHERLMQYA